MNNPPCRSRAAFILVQASGGALARQAEAAEAAEAAEQQQAGRGQRDRRRCGVLGRVAARSAFTWMSAAKGEKSNRFTSAEGLAAEGLCLADRSVGARFPFTLTLARWPGTDVWACIAPQAS